MADTEATTEVSQLKRRGGRAAGSVYSTTVDLRHCTWSLRLIGPKNSRAGMTRDIGDEPSHPIRGRC